MLANRDAEATVYLQTDGKKLFDSINADLQPLLDLNVNEGVAAACTAARYSRIANG